MTKISGYSALTTVTDGDVLPIVDVSDTTMAATGTTKKITIPNLRGLLLPSGDTSGGTDQAAITAAEATGRTVYLGPGTFTVNGLIKKRGNIWQGSGRGLTTIRLANGSNTDVVKGENFDTLTLSGSTAGIDAWGIRDLTIDGNKTNQSTASFGIRVYGYDFDLINVSIMNCHDDGLYTEWSASSSVPGTNNDSMEARLFGVKIHDNNGHGWHNRGPHDSQAFACMLFRNSSSGHGFWAETQGGRTVAAGSNGVDVSTFAGAGVLNVSTTLGYPTASISSTQGALSVVTSGGSAVITYTGVTATSFTGCTTVSGSGTLTTGNAVTAVGGGYSATATLLHGCHVYGNNVNAYLCDVNTHLIGCVGEGASNAMVLVRAGNCAITGGQFFPAGGTGCGLQIGDATNSASGLRVETLFWGPFAGTLATNAAINIVNDGGSNQISALVFQPSGTAYFGTLSNNSGYRIQAAGASTAANAANAANWDDGIVRRFVPPASNTAYRITPGGATTDSINLNTNQNRYEHVGGLLDRWYSDAYVTRTMEIDGAKAHINAFGTAPAVAADAGNGSSPPTPTIGGTPCDTKGQVSFGSGTGPTSGQQVQVTFAQAYGATPIIVLSPVNAATAALLPYVSGPSGSLFHIAFQVAPTASQAGGTYVVNYHVIGA